VKDATRKWQFYGRHHPQQSCRSFAFRAAALTLMTGMPSWGDHSDAELWAMVSFLDKLPNMTEQDYAKLVIASMAHGGHHGGDQDQTKHDDQGHR
jgi:hypothetical protein